MHERVSPRRARGGVDAEPRVDGAATGDAPIRNRRAERRDEATDDRASTETVERQRTAADHGHPALCRADVALHVALPTGPRASGVPPSPEPREVEAAFRGEERCPEITPAFHARRQVVEAEVVDRDAAFHLAP